MAKTLSNGLIVMEQDDSADLFFQSNNQNMIILNQLFNLQRSGQQANIINKTINNSDWVSDPVYGYSNLVTWTDDLDGNSAVFNLFLLPSNERIFLDFLVESKQITVYTNDNSISVKIHGISL